MWLNSMSQAMYEACNQVGADGDLCKELLFDVVVRSITGRHATNIRGWEIKSPDGRIYKFSNEVYTSDTGSGSVVIRDVHNSRIVISDLAGRDITNGTPKQGEPHSEKGER